MTTQELLHISPRRVRIQERGESHYRVETICPECGRKHGWLSNSTLATVAEVASHLFDHPYCEVCEGIQGSHN